MLGFMIGTLYVGLLHGLNTWNYHKTTIASIPYRMIFVFVSFLLTLTVTLCGWATIWKMGWVTRSAMDARVMASQQTEPLETELAPKSAVYSAKSEALGGSRDSPLRFLIPSTTL
jgi:hypothetical protein